MSIRFRLTGFVVLVILCGFSTEVRSQTLIITSVQYQAPAGCTPAKVRPEGTFSYPGTGQDYRPFVDYGYLAKGVFKKDANVSAGGEGNPEVITKVGGGDDGNWSRKNVDSLNKWKNGLVARARVQQYNATTMAWDDVAGTAVYSPIPNFPGGGGCEPESEPMEPDPFAAIRGLRQDAFRPWEDVA